MRTLCLPVLTLIVCAVAAPPAAAGFGDAPITPRALDAAGNELKDAVTLDRRPISSLGGGESIVLHAKASTARVARIELFQRRPLPGIVRSDSSEMRVMRFPVRPRETRGCVVEALSNHVESAHMIAICKADRSDAFVLAGEGATIGIDIDETGAVLGTIAIDCAILGAGSGAFDATVSCLAASDSTDAIDAIDAIEWVRGSDRCGRPEDEGVPLASITVANAPRAYSLERRLEVRGGRASFVDVLVRGALGRPLDLFRGEGVPSLWASFAEGSKCRTLLVDPAIEARTIAIVGRDILPGAGERFEVDDLETGEVLGHGRDTVLVPLPPGGRRFLQFVEAKSDSPPTPKILLVHGPSPRERFGVDAVSPDAPDLAARALDALHGNGIVFVALKGGDDLETVPGPLASLMIPTILPYHAVRRSETLKGGLERIAQFASNVEWALGFPPQDVDSRDWLVCLEAGFYATPLQPRLVDGMPAARGFAVFMNPGIVVVTSGLSESELDRMAQGVRDPVAATDVLRRVVDAQQAVRLSREPTGLFKALSRLPRWTQDDFVPGDPIVMMRWAAMVTGKTQRRLRSLPVAKGAPSLPEDVFEFTSPIQFALDLPQPFQQPIVAVVRSVKEDSGDVILAYQDRPLERIARSNDERGLWREEIFVLRPEWTPGQVRVALSLLAEGGIGRVARVAFFASRSDDGIPLALLAPLAISPNPAAVGICHRIDGTPLLDRGEAHFNGLEMLAGSEVAYELPSEAKPRRLEFGATAMGTAAILVVRADGSDKARYELSPNAKEPLRARLEIIGAKRLEFLVETAAGSGGSVFVLDPRVR